CPGFGLPPSPSAFGNVEQVAEPRGRDSRLFPDYLEVFEGPSRPSALFFQTRSSTAASPSARVRSSTWASSWASRGDGPGFPAASAVLPASRNSVFHRPIDCSETFSFRAASATVTSPASTLSTMLVLVSGLNTAGRPLVRSSCSQTPIMPSYPVCQKAWRGTERPPCQHHHVIAAGRSQERDGRPEGTVPPWL